MGIKGVTHLERQLTTFGGDKRNKSNIYRILPHPGTQPIGQEMI